MQWWLKMTAWPGGVVAALTAQGMAGIPVGGQDGDQAAINRVALGTQTVSVWKNAQAISARSLAKPPSRWLTALTWRHSRRRQVLGRQEGR